MTKPSRYLGIAGFLVFASVGFAQYNMDLTGVGDGANADGVYVSPYTGTITGSGVNYSGNIICDDFTDESFVGDTWNASGVNAASVNGSQLFTGGYSDPWNGKTYNAQQDYDAVAWLANQLVMSSNLTNWTAQTNISFAIWDIMDGQATDPDGGATGTNGLIDQAFAAVAAGQIYTNVSVFTPSPKQQQGDNVSQEFLVVGNGSNNNVPLIQTSEPSSAAVLGFDLLSVLAVLLLVRRYRVRA